MGALERHGPFRPGWAPTRVGCARQAISQSAARLTGWLQLADADAQCREYRMHNHQLQAMNAKLRKEALSPPRPSAAARHMADADWCVLGRLLTDAHSSP